MCAHFKTSDCPFLFDFISLMKNINEKDLVLEFIKIKINLYLKYVFVFIFKWLLF